MADKVNQNEAKEAWALLRDKLGNDALLRHAVMTLDLYFKQLKLGRPVSDG